jgi:XTP/dITP diphosphohydrolase
MTTIVLASGNQKKLRELQAMLAAKNVSFVPQTQFNIAEAVEDGLSFVENAIIKARYASKLTGLPAIADDSGLEVDALGGAPGIYSARFASMQGEGNSDDAANNTLLLEKLRDVEDSQRTARFQCVLALMRFPDDPMPLICQGTWEGRMLRSARGANGFGYDPLFFVPELNCASAELAPEIKNRISHRALALQQLLQRWPF